MRTGALGWGWSLVAASFAAALAVGAVVHWPRGLKVAAPQGSDIHL
jgi:hypothetical protein